MGWKNKYKVFDESVPMFSESQDICLSVFGTNLCEIYSRSESKQTFEYKTKKSINYFEVSIH